MILFEFFTPFQLVSLNDLLGVHYRLKSSHKKAWLAEIRGAAYAGRVKPVKLLEGEALLTITRVLAPGQREFDNENFAGGSAKQLVDALVTLGWLEDDAPKWLRREYITDASNRASPGTRVRLERVSKNAGDARVLLEALQTYAGSANGAVAIAALEAYRGTL